MAPITAILLLSAGTPGHADVVNSALTDYRGLDVDADTVELPMSPHAAEWDDTVATVQAADIIVLAGLTVDSIAVLIQRIAIAEVSLDGAVAALLPGAGDDATGRALLVELTRFGCAVVPVTDIGRLAADTLALARELQETAKEQGSGRRKLFDRLPTDASDLDPAAIEAEKRAAAQDRLVERRKLVDLTRRDKGLPEKRELRRPDVPGLRGDDPPR